MMSNFSVFATVVLIALCVQNVCSGKSTKRDVINSDTEEKDIMNMLLNQIKKLENELHDSIDRIAKLENGQPSTNNENFVGFSARVRDGRDYIAGMAIRFPEIVSNSGNAYNPSTGVFTCPVTGYYLFTADMLAARGTYLDTYILLNDEQVGNMLAEDHDTFGQASGSVIVLCNAGYDVSINCYYDCQVHGSGHSAFSGVLLKLY